jgi:hypothetical protein
MFLVACVATSPANTQPKSEKEEQKKDDAKPTAVALPPITVQRIKFAEDLYYTVHCRVASGNAAAEVEAALEVGGLFVKTPGYATAKAIVVAAVKLAGLKKGTTYCTGWPYSDPVKVKLRNADKAHVTIKLYAGSKLLVERKTERHCRFRFCITKSLKGGPTVDGMTACVDMQGKSAVVALGSGKDKVDTENSGEAQLTECRSRKF